MDLKWLLIRRIALVAMACLIVGALLLIYQSALATKRQNLELVDGVGRQMDHRFSMYGRVEDIPERFPDWDLVTTPLLQSGQCAELRTNTGEVRHLNCAGLDRAAVSAPAWFVWLYRNVAGEGSSASAMRELFHRGTVHGSVVARYEPIASASLAWNRIAPLLGFAAALVAVLCLMTFLVIDRALRPTKQIVDGLNRMARGDMAFRLPAFRLLQFDRISAVFNYVAAELTKANVERAGLARRLVDAQERERRHIARELHDEIAQTLSALNAQAAILRTKAEREEGSLAAEAAALQSVISNLMQTVRRTLTNLRPQELDDLGLVASLEALVAHYNKTAAGTTLFTLQLEGALDGLNAETNAHVYRIVQEALTNAAKHANARNVQIVLRQSQKNGANGHELIQLRIADDGIGTGEGGSPKLHAVGCREVSSAGTGAGLVGMRERVAALSGTFSAAPVSGGGFALEIEFPCTQQGA
ncbi:sensor histidine kinase [Hyphomicrobium sp. D-2]|uniref:sensor histidine kinase n=1 Tax=Hyphomicrobium sp. D-2 TaxID=3041621 RepID=UPI0024573D45|nr:sensor histidine kinase [Hyphomicrobium sp. D-2]MDH4980710.1 sensor histidine kinase [Hyphomicrobium sp. D-2]